MPHCIDEGTVKKFEVEQFDGKNWETSMKKHPSIKDRSKDNNNQVDVMY